MPPGTLSSEGVSGGGRVFFCAQIRKIERRNPENPGNSPYPEPVSALLDEPPVAQAPLWEIGRPAWHKYAVCFEGGTAAFFPQDPEEERSGYMDAVMKKRIQSVCSNCPVLIECFVSSIENRDEYGYWAGIGPTTRYRILRDLKKGEITLGELTAALAFRGPTGLADAYRK